MKKGITRFISKKPREETLINEFFRLAKKVVNDKYALRELEEALLKPQPIPDYKGTEVGRTSFKRRSLIIAFPNETYIKRLQNHIRLNTYKDNNTWDVDIFIELINLLDSKRLLFNTKKKKFELTTRNGMKVTL